MYFDEQAKCAFMFWIIYLDVYCSFFKGAVLVLVPMGEGLDLGPAVGGYTNSHGGHDYSQSAFPNTVLQSDVIFVRECRHFKNGVGFPLKCVCACVYPYGNGICYTYLI